MAKWQSVSKSTLPLCHIAIFGNDFSETPIATLPVCHFTGKVATLPRRPMPYRRYFNFRSPILKKSGVISIR